MVVVAENSAAGLIDVLRKAGAFPIVETRWADAPAAIAEILPVALAIADPQGAPSPQHVGALMQCIETRGGPVTPVIALVESNGNPAIPSALPIALDDSTDRLIARLRSALRIRTLHATVCCGGRAPRAQRSEHRRSSRPICSMMPPCSASDAAAHTPRFRSRSANASASLGR